jgi:hypothetical protein
MTWAPWTTSDQSTTGPNFNRHTLLDLVQISVAKPYVTHEQFWLLIPCLTCDQFWMPCGQGSATKNQSWLGQLGFGVTKFPFGHWKVYVVFFVVMWPLVHIKRLQVSQFPTFPHGVQSLAIITTTSLHLQWRTPKLLDGLNCESKNEGNERKRSLGMLPNSQPFGIKGRAKFPNGTRKINKQFTYSHRLAQTKQQVG